MSEKKTTKRKSLSFCSCFGGSGPRLGELITWRLGGSGWQWEGVAEKTAHAVTRKRAERGEGQGLTTPFTAHHPGTTSSQKWRGSRKEQEKLKFHHFPIVPHGGGEGERCSASKQSNPVS
jgi:hypothetical protein